MSDYLRAKSSITSIGGGTRIVHSQPPEIDKPWVLVTPIDGRGGLEDHLIDFVIQLDCYAGPTGGKPEAGDLARKVRDALVQMRGSLGGAVVAGVEIVGWHRIADPTFEKARDRFIITAQVWAHS